MQCWYSGHPRRNGAACGENQPMSSRVAPVSCYIRTLNEERKIGDVVGALHGVVDEVVVVREATGE